MHYSEIDYDLISQRLREEGYVRAAPSVREEAKQRVKDAFAEGRLIAGLLYMDASRAPFTGCVLGQLNYNPSKRQLLDGGATTLRRAFVCINNHACVGAGEIPDRFVVRGVPHLGGSRNQGIRLTRIEPLLELIERCM